MESLQFDLSLKSVLHLHHHVNHLEPVIVPFFDSTQVLGATIVVDDEGHSVVVQAFLGEDEFANSVIVILEWEYILEADVKKQNMVPFVPE